MIIMVLLAGFGVLLQRYAGQASGSCCPAALRSSPSPAMTDCLVTAGQSSHLDRPQMGRLVVPQRAAALRLNEPQSQKGWPGSVPAW